MTLHFRGPKFLEKWKTRSWSPILGGSFPSLERGCIREEQDLFMPCLGAFSEPPLWIQSAVCPTRLALRLCAVGCVRPNPVQFQSRPSTQPAWNKQYSRICMENENCVSAGNSQLYVAKGTNALTINIRASVSRCRCVYPRCFQAISMKSTLTPSNVQTIGHGLITAASG